MNKTDPRQNEVKPEVAPVTLEVTIMTNMCCVVSCLYVNMWIASDIVFQCVLNEPQVKAVLTQTVKRLGGLEPMTSFKKNMLYHKTCSNFTRGNIFVFLWVGVQNIDFHTLYFSIYFSLNEVLIRGWFGCIHKLWAGVNVLSQHLTGEGSVFIHSFLWVCPNIYKQIRLV